MQVYEKSITYRVKVKDDVFYFKVIFYPNGVVRGVTVTDMSRGTECHLTANAVKALLQVISKHTDAFFPISKEPSWETKLLEDLAKLRKEIRKELKR